MIPKKTGAVLEQLLFACHVFILVLVLAESRLLVPDWLHVFGRLHPLLLHFPIVLLLMAAALLAFPALMGREKERDFRLYGGNLLLLGCLAAAFTVIAGLLLSAEEGYEREALRLHKWTGLGVFWLASLLYLHAEREARTAVPAGTGGHARGIGITPMKAGAFLLAAAVLASGHFGAAITHGEDFITAPLAKNKEPDVSLEEAEVFAHLVMPVLEKKCISCHKASKQKGELRLDRHEFILTGGESGAAVTAGDVENSLLLSRIHLPPEEEEHMPPKGKPQLTDEEKELLEEWVRAGAETETKILALEESAPLYRIGTEKFSAPADTYGFPPADGAKVEALNSFYRKVQRLGADSPALSASYFGSSVFDPASLAELADISTQLVSLNLNNMPLGDSDLLRLRSFVNLEKLYLNSTGISGEGLQHLAGLEKLALLSLSGNTLDPGNLESLGAMTGLKRLFIWNTGLGEGDLEKLEGLLPDTKIETGYRDDGTAYTLNPPVISFDRAFFRDKLTVRLEHPVQGTSIFYTLDGTGPDSSNHILYEGPLEIAENMEINARAFAPGWLGSATATAEFVRSGIAPSESVLMFPPAERYKGDGVNSLFDGEKAVRDVWDLNWLGFRDSPLEVEMSFEKPTDINGIALSIWLNTAARFFPPREVEIWTASAEGQWTQALKHRPRQPSKNERENLLQMEIPFSEQGVERMKFIARPLDRLPTWHGGAGDKAWIMVDELVIN